jgi:RND family efflux transporter MFP subunit
MVLFAADGCEHRVAFCQSLAKRGAMDADSARKFFRNRETALATLAVVVVLLVSMTAVAVFKRPGQMGVIESQSMDMTKITPPPGAVPVAVAKVRYKDIDGSVTYTGTVQAFNDDDIYPRITGRLTHVYVYPGDHVRAGQLLATLDTANSEYEQRALEARYRAMAGTHAVDIAKQDYQEKQHQYKASIEAEARARKNFQETQANLDYWKTEIEREKKLLDQSVVSKQEYDSELAQYREAEAKVEAAKSEIGERTEQKIAAQEASEGMFQHIQHSGEEAKALAASAQAQGLVQSYTRLTAPANGVVTKRDVSPGVLVNPGTRILRIAQLDDVRLQAEVATTDVDRIRVGTPVEVRPSAESNEVLHAKVTARFPAADPTSRTSVIEALVPNHDDRFLPGQYVVMNISTGSKNALTVPSSALVYSGDKVQVWKAVGAQPPKVAMLTDVKVGLRNDDRAEILSGLKDGDEVIYHGQEGLQPDSPVYPVEWGPVGPTKLPTGEQVASNRLSAINHWKLSESIDGLSVTASMQPVPVTGDSNQLIIQLRDAAGKPIEHAAITAKTNMPTMSMAGPDLQASDTGAGTYVFNSNFMSTLWDVDLTIKNVGSKPVPLKLQVEVP